MINSRKLYFDKQADGNDLQGKVVSMIPEFVGPALRNALLKVDAKLDKYADKYPSPSSTGLIYEELDNIEWTSSFWTGQLWLAYELTGDEKYLHIASMQVESYLDRVQKRINTNHHDLGFLYTLSCVSAWKLTKNERARAAALMAADQLLERYHPKAGIIQAWGDLSDPEQQGRMIIDCNLNLPLLYWASQETGDDKYRQAATSHVTQASKYIVRDDWSTFHTFYMNAETGAPVKGTTHQGHSDDSCWSRGQAWGIYGFPLSYRYIKDESLLVVAKNLADYFLARLPTDSVCCWDLIFTDNDAQRDTSAAAIAAAGLLELADFLPESDSDRMRYRDAATMILSSLAQHYQATPSDACEGILKNGVYHIPRNIGVNECCIWGDYFYLEALTRLSMNWAAYW